MNLFCDCPNTKQTSCIFGMPLFLLGLSAIAVMSALLLSDIAHAQLLSDATGLVNRISIPTSDNVYEVVITSSFDVLDYTFDATARQLTLHTGVGLSNNIAEIIIPTNLLSGKFTLYVDDMRHNVTVKSTDTISFLVLNFADDTDAGSRDGHTIDIIGTKTSAVPSPSPSPSPTTDHFSSNASLSESSDDDIDNDNTISDIGDDDSADIDHSDKGGGGCLVATAAFGSESSNYIQHLREIRDTKIASTESGRLFLGAFNSIYYTFSPFVADYERENSVFKDATRIYLGPMLLSLGIMNHAESGSEMGVLAYGMLVLALNAGVYVVAPVVLAMFASGSYAKRHIA